MGRGLSVLLGDGGDGLVGEEGWGVVGLLPLELKEGLGSEGGVSDNGNVFSLAKVDQVLLNEVWVVLYT